MCIIYTKRYTFVHSCLYIASVLLTPHRCGTATRQTMAFILGYIKVYDYILENIEEVRARSFSLPGTSSVCNEWLVHSCFACTVNHLAVAD